MYFKDNRTCAKDIRGLRRGDGSVSKILDPRRDSAARSPTDGSVQGFGRRGRHAAAERLSAVARKVVQVRVKLGLSRSHVARLGSLLKGDSIVDETEAGLVGDLVALLCVPVQLHRSDHVLQVRQQVIHASAAGCCLHKIDTLLDARHVAVLGCPLGGKFARGICIGQCWGEDERCCCGLKELAAAGGLNFILQRHSPGAGGGTAL
mmetsp:Transcript_12300/g.29382  ORF Transcript_12300/g.29382 Transcript_12300/m.29382 type:complete len:206 (-) Transcript_12300:159-776(-)